MNSPATLSPATSTSTRANRVVLALVALAGGGGIGWLIASGQSPIKVVAGLLGLGGAILMILRLDWGLLALVFIAYTRFSDVAVQFHGLPSIAKVLLGFLAVLTLLRWLVFRQEPAGWRKAFILTGLYIFVVTAGLLYAQNPSLTAGFLDDLIKDSILAILVVAILQRSNQLRPVTWSLLAAGAFMATITTYQYLANRFDSNFWGFGQTAVMNIIGDTEGQRISGPIGDPNFYAQILVVLVPLALNRMWNERSILLRAIAGYTLLVMLLSIIFTFSRGAFFVLGIITIAALIYRRPRPAEIAVYILVAAIGLSFVPSHYIARLATVSDLSAGTTAIRSEVSFRGRASELLAAWQMFVDHPILGVGAHNYPAYYQEYSRHIGLDPRSEARQPHNLFLEVAAETGIIGLIVFGLILFFSYRSLWQSWKTSHTNGQNQTADLIASFAFALTAYLLTSFFIHAAYPRFFWLLVGLALAMPQVVRSQTRHL